MIKGTVKYFDVPIGENDLNYLEPLKGRVKIKIGAAHRIHRKMRQPKIVDSIIKYIHENYPTLTVESCFLEGVGRWYMAKVEASPNANGPNETLGTHPDAPRD